MDPDDILDSLPRAGAGARGCCRLHMLVAATFQGQAAACRAALRIAGALLALHCISRTSST
eukprot:6199357-Pleurochrysis_carterae.AAC.1